MKGSPSQLEKKREIESTEIINTQSTLTFMRANKSSIYQAKPPVYSSSTLPKEGATDLINSMNLPIQKEEK